MCNIVGERGRWTIALILILIDYVALAIAGITLGHYMVKTVTINLARMFACLPLVIDRIYGLSWDGVLFISLTLGKVVSLSVRNHEEIFWTEKCQGILAVEEDNHSERG